MNPSDNLSAIEKALEGVTPGPWTVDDESDDYEISIVGRPTWKCTRFGVEGEWDVAHIEIINGRDAETKANAAYIDACSTDRMREVLAFVRALQREIAEKDARIAALEEALQRISELTPACANARDARDMHLTVKAIADVALSSLRPAGVGSATDTSDAGTDVTNHGSKSILDPEYVTPAGDA